MTDDVVGVEAELGVFGDKTAMSRVFGHFRFHHRLSVVEIQRRTMVKCRSLVIAVDNDPTAMDRVVTLCRNFMISMHLIHGG